MRVTEGSSARHALAGVQYTSSKLDSLSTKMSSGRQIGKPSDNPIGTSQALGVRAELKRMDQYAANASDGLGWLTAADSSLGSVVKQLQSVQTWVVQGLNTGATDSTAGQALAQQVDQVKASLLATANSTYQGRPIFGGTTAGSVAFDASGNYVGDSGTIKRTVAANTSVAVNADGVAAFGTGSSSVFALLDDISNKLRTSPSSLGPSLDQLKSAISQVSLQQSSAGANYAQIQQTQTVNSTNTVQLKTRLSDLEDIDLADMAIQVSTADAAYQAALATTAKVRQTSLLDYLR